MSPPQILFIGLLMQLTAAFSAFMTPAIQARYAISGMNGILACVGMGLAMCVWGLVGLRSRWEMYLCAVWFGLVRLSLLLLSSVR